MIDESLLFLGLAGLVPISESDSKLLVGPPHHMTGASISIDLWRRTREREHGARLPACEDTLETRGSTGHAKAALAERYRQLT